jgi:hypothetical protein
MSQPATIAQERVGRTRLPIGDLIGVACVVIAGVAVLIPALAHGRSLGPYDTFRYQGLLQRAGGGPRSTVFSDQMTAIIPWQTLVWRQVHAGHLPLWTPFNGFGTPLAFNWQSAAFSLPTVVGYALPISVAYSASILVTILTAGLGAYVFCRVLPIGVIGAACAGITFELSGSLAGWLGYPHSSAASWLGWVFAAGLLVIRRPRSARSIAFLAVVTAMSVYAGQPEVTTFVILSFAIFAAVVTVPVAVRQRTWSRVWITLGDLALATAAGFALAAPLLLPGSLAARDAARNVKTVGATLPIHDLLYSVLPQFDGLPFKGSIPFGQSFYVSETAMYIGVVALVLAVVACVRARDHSEVTALLVLFALFTATVFLTPVARAAAALPFVGTSNWVRLLLPLSFVVAVLAGVGADALASAARFRVWTATLALFVGALLGLALMFAFGRGNLPGRLANIRRESFVWPVASALIAIVVVAVTILLHRTTDKTTHAVARIGVIGLVATQAVFLIVMGAPLRGSSATFYPTTQAVTDLRDTVGDARIAYVDGGCGSGAVAPNINAVFDLRVLAAYDPMLASATWTAPLTGSRVSLWQRKYFLFCPNINSTDVARLYGVRYLVGTVYSPPPKGAIFRTRINSVRVYEVPGAALATAVPVATADSPDPPLFANGTPLKVEQPNPADWRIRVSQTTPARVRLRIADVPGMHAEVDGKTMPIRRFANTMVEIDVPAGRHDLHVYYWPTSFTAGILLASITALLLAAWLLVPPIRRVVVARRGRHQVQPAASTPKTG